ncbi:metallophosphoesterase [Bacillus chungangensis]|uniref:MPP superfamily phosphohydrolase n=1 Tax=Bacillus chungangensis TaxID=587633 RepID=A0ABT9WUT6_9BACI|nr:metallophosphoesterase [Bacillus chungangensis]MDQ0176956.1 putative MPP superfamily phosphohydrolase [Bacillus chungangensis]
MNERISRRSFLKKSITTILSILGLTTGGYVYAKYFEPKRLQINKVNIEHHKIPASFNGMKMIQFSDTHLGFQYNLQQLEKHVDLINQMEPDLLFFTGDLMDKPNQYTSIDYIAPILDRLHAPLGKFAIFGNHDHGGNGTRIYEHIMQSSGFQLLNNEAVNIKLLDGEEIVIAGIDDAMLGTPDIPRALRDVPHDRFTILLSHAPDLADYAAVHGVDCQLSGHSHGGQVKIPFFGPLVTVPYAKKYWEGSYDINGTAPLFLYVNRGLGTTRMPFRFAAVPEITIFTLKSM